jgi:hypothetical protein
MKTLASLAMKTTDGKDPFFHSVEVVDPSEMQALGYLDNTDEYYHFSSDEDEQEELDQVEPLLDELPTKEGGTVDNSYLKSTNYLCSIEEAHNIKFTKLVTGDDRVSSDMMTMYEATMAIANRADQIEKSANNKHYIVKMNLRS